MHQAVLWLIPLVLLGVPLAYLVFQIRALWLWRGNLRLAAALPVLGWFLWIAKFASDVAYDPTPQRFVALKILMGAAAALAYLGLLAGLRRLAA